MKKTTLFILALLCHFWGNTQVTNDIETQIAKATSQLDLSECTSGIFTDKNPQYIPLEYFDGSYLSDSTTLTASTFNLMYGMLDKGHINTSPMLAVDIVWQEHNELAKSDTVELTGLFYNYHQLKKTAIDENLVAWDGTYFQDISDATETPFQQNSLFAFTALRNRHYNTEITLHLDNNRFYSNIDNNLGQYEIDYDDGNGWQNLPVNQYVDLLVLTK